MAEVCTGEQWQQKEEKGNTDLSNPGEDNCVRKQEQILLVI